MSRAARACAKIDSLPGWRADVAGSPLAPLDEAAVASAQKRLQRAVREMAG